MLDNCPRMLEQRAGTVDTAGLTSGPTALLLVRLQKHAAAAVPFVELAKTAGRARVGSRESPPGFPLSIVKEQRPSESRAWLVPIRCRSGGSASTGRSQSRYLPPRPSAGQFGAERPPGLLVASAYTGCIPTGT